MWGRKTAKVTGTEDLLALSGARRPKSVALTQQTQGTTRCQPTTCVDSPDSNNNMTISGSKHVHLVFWHAANANSIFVCAALAGAYVQQWPVM